MKSMRSFSFLFSVLFFCLSQHIKAGRLTTWVNPFIGTGGHGHTFPGPVMPFGACQAGPDTRLDGWDGCSGYHYSDSVIYGFSHTHLSGTGCSDYGDILLMPVTHTMLLDQYAYRSSFSHKNEQAATGYYSVYLNDNHVKVELSSTLHGCVHRYTYDPGYHRMVVLDLKHRDDVLDCYMEKVDDYTLQGYRFSKAWARNQKVFFRITFSEKIASIQYEPTKGKSATQAQALSSSPHALILFETEKQAAPRRDLEVKVCISGVDEAGAEKNMKAEMPDWNMNRYRELADAAWEKELERIDVKDADAKNEDKKAIFYTALYHCMIHPSLYSDVDGRYRGRDDKIHSTNGAFNYYTVFSLWDTYRGLHPLLTLIDPQRTSDFVHTFLRQYEEGQRLPIWELSSNETDCMIGYHVVSVIWEAWLKGIRNFDAPLALKAMKSIATQASDYTILKGKLTLKPEARHRSADADALESYCRYGYVRADDAAECVSKTLEFAYDDWCIAQMARALGQKADAAYYLRRSRQWMNVYDPSTGFMRARKNGTLYKPFSPYTVDNNYTEANSWQYSFYVPHETERLIELHGGKEKFESHLDALFTAKTQTEGREQADITGLIGQYAHGNEPSHQIAFLYHAIGRPDKTNAKTSEILQSFYKNQPDGLIGNEDCGQMSAWYVLNALGIYPLCPGRDEYSITIPIFQDVVLNGRSRLHLDSSAAKANAVQINQRITIASKPLMDSNTKEFTSVTTPVYTPDPKIYHQPVSVPYIAQAERVFKKNQSIDLHTLHDEQIFYALGNTPFQRYHQPISIEHNTHIRFYAQSPEDKAHPSPVQEADFSLLPSDRQVKLKSTYNHSYSAGGPAALVDGLHGKLNWRAGDWQGYQGQDVEVWIVLNEAKPIHHLEACFLEDQMAWIFYPKAVTFYTAMDTTHWEKLERIETHKSDHNTQVSISTFSNKTEPARQAKYIRMVAENFGPMPQWHEGRGNATFIFLDEIDVK